MNETEKFLFDLEGYLIVENVLGESELSALNALVDNRLEDPWDNDPVNDSIKCSAWGQATTDLIDHPRILPYLIELLGPRVRIDHDYAIIMNQGEGRGGLHGGHSHGGTHFYRCHDGTIYNGLTVATYFLSEAAEGDGGFACIPGSHKSNFMHNLPDDVRSFERPAHYVRQPPARAGDALIFTEALMHGTLPWRGPHQRRALLYKYSPGHCSWSQSIYDFELYGELTEQRQRIMAPPSAEAHPEVVQ